MLWLRIRNLLPNELNKFLAGQGEIVFRRDGFAELNFHFVKAAEGMEAASLGGDQLHVGNEDRHDGDARFLRDEINPRLTGGHVHAVAARAFGKHDEMKFFARATEGLEFLDAIGIHLAAFEQESGRAAEEFSEPRGVPDVFVAEHENRIATRTPAQGAEQDGVKQADVVDGEKVALLRIEAVQSARAAQIWQGEEQGCAQAEPPLHESQCRRNAGMCRHGDNFRR